MELEMMNVSPRFDLVPMQRTVRLGLELVHQSHHSDELAVDFPSTRMGDGISEQQQLVSLTLVEQCHTFAS